MEPTKNTLLRATFPAFLVTALGLSSCSTQRDATYETDGIYRPATRSVEQTAEAAPETNSSYYKQYFGSRAKAYENIPEDTDVLFTDVEAYSTVDSIDEKGQIIDGYGYADESYGAWGENAPVTVNVYASPWMYSGWGWGYGWGFGWYHPWGWYGGWGWGIGYGYGWCPTWWYGGWGYPYYGYRPYYNGYYSDYNRMAYSRGRSNQTAYNRSRTTQRNTRGTYDRGRVSANRGATTRTRTYSRQEIQGRIRNSRSVNANRARTQSRYNSSRGVTRPSTGRAPSRSRSSGYSRPSGSSRSSGMSRGGGGTRGGGGRSGGRR